MNRYIIGSLWDRINRNGANKNFEYLFEGRQKIDELNYRADKILRDAEVVNQNNNNTNKRLDRIIADSGTSSTEIIDARGSHEVLSARLNKYDYLVERPMLNNGKIILPSDFPELPFNIYRKNKYEYGHDATPFNQFDWSNATEIFLTDDRISNFNGLSIEQATDSTTFRTHYDNGVYGNQDTFIFTLVDNIYAGNGSISFTGTGIKNVLIRSKSPQGRTILSFAKRTGTATTEWIRHNNIYKTTITNRPDHVITDIFNAKQTDAFRLPSVYVERNSIAQVVENPGSYYKSDAVVYCNPHRNELVTDLVLTTRFNYFPARQEHQNIIFENILFLNDTTQFNYVNGIDALFFFSCGFLRGYGADAFNMRGGKYNVYLLDCVSAYGTKDGFNYSTTNSDSLAVEVNCKSYGNGLFKRGGNTTTHSNNGSTAHNGMHMLRVGSHYWTNEGPPVADVNDCYSISIGVKVGDILNTTNGHRDAFHLSAESGTAYKPKFVIECESYGQNIVNGINAPQGNAFYMDFTGKTSIIGATELEGW